MQIVREKYAQRVRNSIKTQEILRVRVVRHQCVVRGGDASCASHDFYILSDWERVFVTLIRGGARSF
jgi:hypothetical protein